VAFVTTPEAEKQTRESRPTKDVHARESSTGGAPFNGRTSRSRTGSRTDLSRAYRSVWGWARLGAHASIDFLERRVDLGLADGVRSGRPLPDELGACQPERFDRPVLLGIRYRRPPAAPLVLARVHLFLEPGFCVDQSFTCITHVSVFPR
jgi:hypothetical protein